MKKQNAGYFELFKTFVKMDFFLRYQNSVLGFVWVFLKPFSIFLVLLTVFSFFGGNVEHFSIYLLLGIILFQFFSDGTNFGMHAILSKAHVILKIPFPKTVVVLSGVFGAFLHLFFAFLVFLFFLWFKGIYPSISNFLIFGVLMVTEFFFILGLSFFTSLWIIAFRDLGQIWEILLTLFFYLVPIFYPLSIVPESIQKIYWFNPLTQIITFAREVLIYDNSVPMQNVWILFFSSVAFGGVGFLYFRKKIQYFTERI